MLLQAACESAPQVVRDGHVDVLSGAAPLHAAAAAGEAEAVSLLLQHGAPIDSQDGQNNTAIQACTPIPADSVNHIPSGDMAGRLLCSKQQPLVVQKAAAFGLGMSGSICNQIL